jgi:hypothetical protein
MADAPFEVSALLVTGFKRACVQLQLAEAARALMEPDVAAMWDRPDTSRWHPGHLFQHMTEALVKVASREQMAEMNYRMCRDQFGPIVTGMIRIAVALTGPSPHTVFGNLKPMVGLAIRGAVPEYERTGPQSGKFAMTYPLPFPDSTANAWAGVMRYCCELVGRTAVLDRVETLQSGHRYEIDLHW